MGSKRSADGGRPRVVLADDHREMQMRVTALLASEFNVVAAFGDGETLVDAEADLRPDVLVIDITMPGISGLEAATLIRRRGSQVPIVFLSVHEEAEFVLAARRTGALGYVSKVPSRQRSHSSGAGCSRRPALRVGLRRYRGRRGPVDTPRSLLRDVTHRSARWSIRWMCAETDSRGGGYRIHLLDAIASRESSVLSPLPQRETPEHSAFTIWVLSRL